jgi:hypothetical protein
VTHAAPDRNVDTVSRHARRRGEIRVTDIERHLHEALGADDDSEKNYHIRQALQHCDTAD